MLRIPLARVEVRKRTSYVEKIVLKGLHKLQNYVKNIKKSLHMLTGCYILYVVVAY